MIANSALFIEKVDVSGAAQKPVDPEIAAMKGGEALDAVALAYPK